MSNWGQKRAIVLSPFLVSGQGECAESRAVVTVPPRHELLPLTLSSGQPILPNDLYGSLGRFGPTRGEMNPDLLCRSRESIAQKLGQEGFHFCMKLRTVTVGKSLRLPGACLRDFANTVADADHCSAAARIQISLSVGIVQIHPFGDLGDAIIVSEAAGKDEVRGDSAHSSADIRRRGSSLGKIVTGLRDTGGARRANRVSEEQRNPEVRSPRVPKLHAPCSPQSPTLPPP